MNDTPTFYEILDVPPALQNEPVIPAQTLRGAYRRALLQNHPDKATNHTVKERKKGTIYSIDQISLAFATLSDAAERARYDRELRVRNAGGGGGVDGQGQIFRTGVETVDLDDLDFEEDGNEVDGMGVWFRGCRCGDERGFLLTEKDLEDAVEDGEVGVGCRGCSLWLRVLFGIVEEVDEGGEEEVEGRDEVGNTGVGA